MHCQCTWKYGEEPTVCALCYKDGFVGNHFFRYLTTDLPYHTINLKGLKCYRSLYRNSIFFYQLRFEFWCNECIQDKRHELICMYPVLLKPGLLFHIITSQELQTDCLFCHDTLIYFEKAKNSDVSRIYSRRRIEDLIRDQYYIIDS